MTVVICNWTENWSHGKDAEYCLNRGVGGYCMKRVVNIGENCDPEPICESKRTPPALPASTFEKRS